MSTKDTELDAKIVRVARMNPELSMQALIERFAGQAGHTRIRRALENAGMTPPPHRDGLSTLGSGRRRVKQRQVTR
jgi:hypothetical protein